MAPLQALVEISARLIVCGERSSRRTIAHSTGERWSTFVFARQSGTRCDRAGRLLVGAIFTVFFTVAKLRLCDTFGRTIGTAVWTKKLIVRTGDRRTVRLVTLIGAVVIAVTMKVRRNAESVFTSKLAIMTGGEVCEKKMKNEMRLLWPSNTIDTTYCTLLRRNYRHNRFYGCILTTSRCNAVHWHIEIDRDDTMCRDSHPRRGPIDSRNIHHISSRVAHKYQLACHCYSCLSHWLVIHSECHLVDIYDDLNLR